ncbi:alpha/beta hydrolase [Lignipirellula cremea]|uniref:Acetylxylan esterase n=1 Tax=Lignipirellula cremea TaxID=2528010 RepID=A0A518E2N2_9BACT|nr:alpha/beta hydrolase [Lignipirellula cremea]QDU98350.1 Acetylxylan esterase precursor [Lignipirellula cremea]
MTVSPRLPFRRFLSLIVLLLVAASFSVATAAEPKSEPIWPQGAPGALGETANDQPQLIISLPDPDRATGAAIVICPGGGYGHLAMSHEGRDVADWLNNLGVAAFVCDYRHRGKGYGHPAPMQDVQRALRIVRARAKEFHVDPQRIGVLGFSAGGHLASTAATHFDAGDAEAADPLDRVSCRPDFAILCYPVILLGNPLGHAGSQKNLLGENADPALIAAFSNEKQVTAETPPTFLWHTSEDRGVPPQNSVAFYLALLDAKVPAELHIFEKGGHGMGLVHRAPELPAANWPKLCEAWLRHRGLLNQAD